MVSTKVPAWLDTLQEDNIYGALSDLPYWETGSTPSEDAIKMYRDFFDVVGSHMIYSCHYGSRLEVVSPPYHEPFRMTGD